MTREFIYKAVAELQEQTEIETSPTILPHHERYFPRALFESHPQLLDGETVHLPHDSIITVDFLGYSTLMSSEDHLDEATLLMDDWQNKLTEIAEDHHLVTVKGAGDEVLFIGRIHFISRIIFSLKSLKAFNEKLDEYPDTKKYLIAKRNLNPPYVHIGIDSPAEGSTEYAMLKTVDLGSKKDLMIMGNVLLAKDIAEGYLAHTDRSGIIIADSPKERHLKLLREAGLAIQEHRPTEKEGSVPSHFTVKVPNIDEIDGIIENLTTLRSQGTLTETTEAVTVSELTRNEQKNTDLDLVKLAKIARGMCPLYLQGEVDRPRPEHSKDINHQGEAYFGFVYGGEQLIDTIIPQIQRLIPGNMPNKDKIVLGMDILAQTEAFIAKKMSKKIVDAGGAMKETEFNSKFTQKLLGFGDGVYARSENYQGEMSVELFEAALESVGLLESKSFKNELMEEIVRELGNTVDQKVLEEIINSTNFYAHVGLSSCESDNLNWAINEQGNRFKGGDNVRGSLLTAAGRFVSQLFEKRQKETMAKFEQEGDTKNFEQLKELVQKSNHGHLIVQKKVAERLGVLESATFVITNMPSKGFDKPFDLAIFRP